MKLKTMDIQKFLLTGWYPKMAYNGMGICEVGDFGDEMFNRSNKAPILHIPC